MVTQLISLWYFFKDSDIFTYILTEKYISEMWEEK